MNRRSFIGKLFGGALGVGLLSRVSGLERFVPFRRKPSLNLDAINRVMPKLIASTGELSNAQSRFLTGLQQAAKPDAQEVCHFCGEPFAVPHELSTHTFNGARMVVCPNMPRDQPMIIRKA